MEERGHPHVHDPVAVQSARARERDRIGRHVLGVVARVETLRVDHRDERVQVRERALAIVLGLADDDLAGQRADVLAVALGPIERRVGLVLQLLERVGVLRAGCDAAAERHAPVAEDRVAADRRPQPLSCEQGVELVRLGQQQAELLAAQSREAVDGADQAADQRADVAQHVVAGLVTQAVVDRLEVVDVEEDER